VSDGQPTGDQGNSVRGSLRHKHPGGTAAILGVQLLRFTGVQGLSIGLANLFQYGAILAVGAILGASDLGRYSLLLFLVLLVSHVIHVATKPGTIRRVYGAGDEDEDDDDEDEAQTMDASGRPRWSLGVGLALCIVLAVATAAIVVAFQKPIADLLLGKPEEGRLIAWAGITAGALAVFRLAEMCLWFERRASAFLVVETARPGVSLVAIVALCLIHKDVESAIIGTLIGTALAAALSVFLLRRGIEWAWDGGEAVEILKLSRFRVPIVTSMWVIQNTDTFILSRFVDHHELGVYSLASRTGFMAALLPTAFRVGLRPLRKGAAYLSMNREYGTQIAQGQLLAYFLLLCLTAVLGVFMLGEALVRNATGAFTEAAGVIPLAAAAMTMPPLFRTLKSTTIHPRGRKPMLVGIIIVAISYIGLALLIVPEIGIYGPPTAMLAAFAGPLLYIGVRSQTSEQPIEIPYWSLLRALVVAVAIGGFFLLVHPDGRTLQLLEVVGLMGVWFAALFVLRIVPEQHRHPLLHMARSTVRGSAMPFKPVRGLRALEPADREALRIAVARALSPAEIEPQGEQLVNALRRAGRKGDAPVGGARGAEAEMALYLFSNESAGPRYARMRAMLAEGVNSHDIRAMEDLVGQLAKLPDATWERAAGAEPHSG
jgi:O-antigen/teichoic acid export membrane protein